MSNLIYNAGTSMDINDSYEYIKKNLLDCQGYIFSKNTTGYDIKITASETEEKNETEENKSSNYIPKKIYFNGPVTVVVWDDGTKTRVRRHDGDPDNRYSAFCAALAKKIFGNNTVVNKIVSTGIYCSSYKTTKNKEGTSNTV